MRTRFLTPALTEFNEAIAYYNAKQSGLGFRFSDEVKLATGRILQYPEAWPFFSNTTRHCQVKGFPYSILYYLQRHELVIVAVMHNRRDPRKWMERLRGINEP